MTQNKQFYLPEVDSAKFVSKRTELIRLQYDVTVRGVNCIAHQFSLPPDVDSAKFDEERKRLSRLRHPNILQHLGVHNDKASHYVVTEALNTTLDKYLATVTDGPISVKVSILRDVSRGLQYLRSQTPPIVHRELIAQNVHLSFDMRAKIAVVGVSVPCDIKQIQSTDIAVYLPPEALTGTQQWSTVSCGFSDIAVSMPLEPLDDTKWDIYSFGVLLAYTALHRLPPSKTSLVKWMDEMGKTHPLYSLACKCVNDCPSDRLPIEDLCQELDTLCESYPVKIIDILHPVQSAESKHIHVQQQDQSSSSISGWFGAISSTISAVPGKVLNAVKRDTVNGTSVDKDNISCQPTMVEAEDEWMKIHVSSKAAESSNNNYSDAPDGKAVVDRKLADTERELDAMKHSLKEEREKYTKQIEALKKEVEAQNQQTGSSWFGAICSAVPFRSSKKDDGSSLDKDMPQISCQPPGLGEDQWMSKVHTLEDQLKFKEQQMAVYKEDFDNERKDRIMCKATLAKCKEELQNKGEELARETQQLRNSEVLVRELQSRLAQYYTERQVKQLHDDYRAQLLCKEMELAIVKSECQSVNGKLVSIEEAMMHNKKLQTSELRKVQEELEAAKEEIAVKVAQVKQYQKQVEAYKQAQPKNQYEQLYNEEKQANACLMEEINQVRKTISQATQASSSGREGTSDLKPLSQSHLESSASKATVHSHISHGCDDSLPPPVMLPKAHHLIDYFPQDSRPTPYPVEASQYQAGGMASLVDIPFDPNLQCPICQRKFRKGEIQLYRQHVELCKNNPD
eukprot:Em0002g1247a